MAAKLEKIMRDYLFISKEQERLKESTSSLSRNSSQLKIMAYNQQLVQDQLRQTTKLMIELSKETFSVTPEIGKAVGAANNSIEQSKSDLTNRNIQNAVKNQNLAMEALNTTAIKLYQSIQQCNHQVQRAGLNSF